MMEKFFLSKNTAVTMTDSADHAIGMLHNYKYNIIILDVDILVMQSYLYSVLTNGTHL